MPFSSFDPQEVFRLTPKIDILPVRHGSGDFAQEIREYLLSRQLDCLALPLPPSVEHLVEQGISHLPSISLVAIPESGGAESPSYSFIPIDPCQPLIMAIRTAMNEDIHRVYIDREVTAFESLPLHSPDPYSLKHVSLASFCSALLPFSPYPKPESQRWLNIKWLAFKLHELELDFESILCLCPMEDWPWIRDAYREQPSYVLPETLEDRPSLHQVTSDTLYFLLGELPYLTELYERRRAEARSDLHLSVDGIKELLIETRTRWIHTRFQDVRQEQNWVTPQLLQIFLQYVRNLSLLHHRLTPDLYTLVLAAKQLAGDDFAVMLLETAKSYVFQDDGHDPFSSFPVSVGINQLGFPSEGEVAAATNRLQGSLLSWKSISLRPTPPIPKKQQWSFQWNPFGQCSWPPEDHRVEGFASHVREQAKQSLGGELARIEKFTTSIRDGIDLRETLRHWKNPSAGSPPEIYVRDIPPSRGKVEVVVFLFEVPADPAKFSWQTTWYAEHAEESTLSFFATPFLENMVGPGIGQAVYGGALFLFPPRPIPNIWEDPRFDFTHSLEERLLAGAFAHSQDPHVVVVSPRPPLAKWRQLAKRYHRHLLPIPLSRFSGQTVSRLRQFHVLNGHEIRSYATKFIRE